MVVLASGYLFLQFSVIKPNVILNVQITISFHVHVCPVQIGLCQLPDTVKPFLQLSNILGQKAYHLYASRKTDRLTSQSSRLVNMTSLKYFYVQIQMEKGVILVFLMPNVWQIIAIGWTLKFLPWSL